MKKLIIPVFLITLCSIPATSHSQMFSLWADEDMTSCSIYTDPDSHTFYSVYVFLEPGPTGVFAAEYKIPQIENHFVVWIEKPLVSIDLGNYYGSPGISIGLNTCQSEIFWICRMDMVGIPPRTREYIRIDPHDDTERIIVATCDEPLRPEVEASVYNYLGINYNCAGTPAPWLNYAEASYFNRVVAGFDYGVEPWADPDYFENHFELFAVGEPPETINVIGGEWLEGDWCFCELVLENDMTELRTYNLVANNICSCCGGLAGCDTSEKTFVFSHIATLLQRFSTSVSTGSVALDWSLSSIDPGTIFHVSRRESDEPFAAIGEMTGAALELSYRFEDRSVSGGMTYIYRVEYVSNTDRGILFETEDIETVPIPVTLAQNHPNPFNPSTTIEFYLPAAGHVSLRVFDVSGRLVRILVDSASEPGSHSIGWDGLDENGNSIPSGVYFSRLSAGKTRLSRKMILLR